MGKLTFVYVRLPGGWVDLFDIPAEVWNTTDVTRLPAVRIEVEDPSTDNASRLQDLLRDLLQAKYGCGGG